MRRSSLRQGTALLALAGLTAFGVWFLQPADPDGGATRGEGVSSAAAAGYGSIDTYELPEEIRFNQHVRPVLSNNCFSCHGPDKNAREGDLRLDTEWGATTAIDDRQPVVPGKPEESHIIERITADDPDHRMPPASLRTVDELGRSVNVSYDPLKPEEIALLVRWIEQGAEYEDHWAYLPLSRPRTPEVENGDWPENAIDAFILTNLEKRDLAPSPEADPVTLLRRVTLDLTGLPPTPGEVEAFLEDEEPGAYERAVDRLLDSKAYGERMAVHWLDQVRYADSTGYHSDETQPVWAYRDYVIRAFNENKPFDAFTREQLGGDLMKEPSREQLIASAFNRLNQTTAEGGAQADEYLAMYMADRVDAVGNAFMGATMSCAQCHDHKFDPYTERDFYEMGAFFADLDEPGVYSHETIREPAMTFTDPEAETVIATLEREVEERERIYDLDAEDRKAFDPWYASLRQRVGEAERRERPWFEDRIDDKGADEIAGAWNYIGAEDGPVHSGEVARLQEAGRETVQHFFTGSHEPIDVPAGSRLYAYVWIDPDDPPETVMLQFNDGSWEHRAFWGADRIDFGGIGNDNEAHRPMGELPDAGQWVRLEVPAAKVGVEGTTLNGMAFTQFGGKAYWDEAGLYTRAVEGVPAEVSLAAARAFDDLDGRRREAVVRAYRLETDPEIFEPKAERLEAIRAELARKRESATHTTLIAGTREEPRETRVLPRGNWRDDSGDVVEPAVPGFLGAIDRNGRANRLDLADWLLSDENPLLGRAVINRYWSLFYGHGLSRVMDDLGGQGEFPTHPDLLDWLAVEFRDSGWDTKHMVRLMVTSATYRQTSHASELREIDPENRLFARQSRFRLPAEFVRDNALAAAGLLNREMFGPPIKPYQPEGYWQHLNFPRRTYEHDTDENQWRRGVYIHWQRTFLHPMLAAFDAPSRESCTAERTESNTPLQALVLLNDPSLVEAARVMAEHILGRPEADPEARIRWAFRRAVARAPEPGEVAVLTELLEDHLAHYKANSGEAEQLLEVGIREPDAGLDPVEIAAWTSVARTILNLHETITRY